MQNDPSAELTGYICPDCGGALSKRDGARGDGGLEYRCRIDHTFTPAQLWSKTCEMRNRALAAAARASAEKIDLARALAAEEHAAGNASLASRLEHDATAEERYLRQLLPMLEDLVEDDGGAQP